MSWGSNGLSSGWGKSGFGASSSGGSTDPQGTHAPGCSENSGFSSGRSMGGYYDEKCSGCRRDRSMNPWGSSGFKTNGVMKILAVTGAVTLGRKSIWD